MELNTTDMIATPSAEPEWESPAIAPTFAVRDAHSANWVVRKIVEARAYAERCAQWAERERMRARREEEFLLLRFGGELRAYARAAIAEQGSRRKSVTLPAGRIGFRRAGAKLVIDDEAAVLRWARKTQPNLVVIEESICKSGLNQYFEDTGEIPPSGVRVEPEDEKFYVK